MIPRTVRREDSSALDVGDRRVARWGAVAWPSFFSAGVATMVFFAIVDPSELARITWPQVSISREAGYTIGFFMFWAGTFFSSLFTLLLSSDDGDGEAR